jgi:hypothetical protein
MCLLQQNNNSSTNNNNNKRRKKNKREKDNVICVDFQKKIKVSVKAPVSVKRRNRERGIKTRAHLLHKCLTGRVSAAKKQTQIKQFFFVRF